jgi:site-specific DNA-cytosine methylase
MRQTLTHESLFSGIGGFDLAFASLGIPSIEAKLRMLESGGDA